MLAKKGRLNIDLTHRSVSAAIGQIKQWPLDMSIARMSTELDFSGDPADQIIAATSIVNEVPLLTRDKTILRSNRVPFCWSKTTAPCWWLSKFLIPLKWILLFSLTFKKNL